MEALVKEPRAVLSQLEVASSSLVTSTSRIRVLTVSPLPLARPPRRQPGEGRRSLTACRRSLRSGLRARLRQ
jgi:hypothetical protein